MWMALFALVTSSSLAYIYGRDEGFYEDYSSVNGREYPRKVVLREGRSSEIKQTVEGCFSRALPGLVADLRLPIPLSTLEQGVVLIHLNVIFLNRDEKLCSLYLIGCLNCHAGTIVGHHVFCGCSSSIQNETVASDSSSLPRSSICM